MAEISVSLGNERFEMKPLERVAIVCMYCLGALLLLASIGWPTGKDHGVFVWVGDVILRGGLPYRDAWEHKGFAAHYTFALTQWLFGRTIWAIRVVDIVLLITTMIALFQLLKRFCNTTAAWIGPFLFLGMHVTRGYCDTAQPDGWAGMFVAIAAVLTMKTEPMSRWQRVAAGALVGLAAMYKILFVALIVPLVVYDFFIQKDDIRKRIMATSLMPTACVFVYGASIFWLWTQGGLPHFLDIQFGFNPTVYSTIGEGSLTLFLARIYESFDALVFFAVIGLCAGWRKSRLLATSLVIYLSIALACIFLQKKYYPYHFIPCDAPIVILYSLGLSWVYDILKRVKISLALKASLRVSLLVSLALVCWWGYGRIYKPSPTSGLDLIFPLKPPGLSVSQLLGQYAHGDFSLLARHQTAEYLSRNTRPDDYVQVWGFEPLINYLSARQAPTRFGFNSPLVISEGTPYYDKYRDEFMSDIRAKQPEYIVVVDGDTSSQTDRTSKQYFDSFTQFSEYVRLKYTLETNIRNFDLWRKK